MNSENENNNKTALINVGDSTIGSLIDGVISIYQTERLIEEGRERDQKQREFEKELEKLRHRNQQQLDIEAFNRQKQLQQELAAYNRQTELQIAAQQRKTALESLEAHKLFENWPLRIVPSQILDSHRGDGPIPLRVIPVPPIVDFEQFATNAEEFPRIEKYLAEGLRQFLHQNYALNDTVRPVELLDGAWDSNRYRGGSSIKALFSMLRSEPILILESEIDGNYFNFRLGYWELGQKNYSYAPVITRLPFREIIYESAKTRAKNWKTARDKILALGQDPKLINELDTYNLEILEQEIALQEAGIDTSKLPPRYKVSNQDFEVFAQFLVECNCLVAGCIADAHHLIQNNVPPLLPQLLGKVPEGIIPLVINGYFIIYESLEKERLEVMPELLLDFANSLKALPDKSWAKKQVDDSLKSWLKLREVTFEEETNNLILAMQPLLMPLEDFSYIRNIGKCLTAIGDESAATQIKEILSKMTYQFDVITVNSQGKEIKREQNEAQYFSEDLEDSVTLEMVAIPGGKFTMGSPEEEGYDSEKPQHKVTVSSFYMGRYPITQDQWRIVAGWEQVEKELNSDPSKFKEDYEGISRGMRPVENICWKDAQEFCNRLSQKTGKEYRLPTQAEWEYACRAGTTTPFHFGETISTDIANYNGNRTYGEGVKGEYREQTTPVGYFKVANYFGLSDMHGNVFEWCEDDWHENYEDAPTDGMAWFSSKSGMKVRRGGSYIDGPDLCRSAYHYFGERSDGYFSIGFRVVCTASRTK